MSVCAEITLLGHASALLRMGGRHVLVNPLFGDRFGEGLLQSCPRRVVRRERMPPIDHVYVTTAELDAFDVESLRHLDRSCPITCVDDADVMTALRLLGFTDIRRAQSGATSAGGRYSVSFTRSARGGHEFGLAFRSSEGSVWHLGNTVPFPDEIDRIKTQLGGVDLLLAPHATQQFTYLGSQRAGFPADHLRGVVGCARQVGARLTIPWSAGFRYRAPLDWVNSFVFPISAERFATELRRTGLEVATALPGDIAVIARPEVAIRRQASPVVACLEDDRVRVAFDPTRAVPSVDDPNLDDYPVALLDATVEQTLEGLSRFVGDSYLHGETLIDRHRERGHLYCVGIVFPDGVERWWRCRFDTASPTIERGNGTPHGAHQLLRLPASVVTARAHGHRRYDFTGGLCRLCIVTPASLVDGVVRIVPEEPPDLLFHYLRSRIGLDAGERHWRLVLERLEGER